MNLICPVNLIRTIWKICNLFMDGRIFVGLISRLRASFKTNNVDDAIAVIGEISSHIVPTSFLTNSSLLDEVLANIFTHSIDSKQAIAFSCQTFLDRWLSFYSAFAPLQFFKMVTKHSKTLSRFMFKVLPPFVFAYKTYFDFHSEEYLKAYQVIMEAAEPQNIVSMTKQVWVLYRDNSTVEQISSLIGKLLKNSSSSFPVSVLVRKCPEQLVDQVFQEASLDYILAFLEYLPTYVKFDIITASVRVADAIFCNMGEIKTAYKIIPYIIKRKLDDAEEAALYPIWEKVKNDCNNHYALAALYAAAKYGIFPLEEVITYLHFSDRSDSKVRVESIKIGFEILYVQPFRKNFIKMLKELSQTRETPSFSCMVENLITYFPVFKDIDIKSAYEVVNNALSPTPEGDNVPLYVLRFLNSLDDLLDPKFTFDVSKIIRLYTHIENYNSLIEPLKTLIYRLSLNIDSMNIDYFNPKSYKKLQLIDSIDPHLLSEAIQLGLVPFNVLSFVVDKLRQPYCFEGALGSLVCILNTIGFKINYKYIEYWVTEEDVLQNVEMIRVAFVVSVIGKLMVSLLRCIVDLFDQVEISNDKKLVLMKVAKSLSSAVPDDSIRLQNKLNTSDIDFTYASPNFFANYLACYGSPEQAIEKGKDKIVAACTKDYNLASLYAPFLEQPLPPMPTYHAFENIDKHKKWLELSKEHYLPEQVINPIEKIHIPEKEFKLKEICIEKSIAGLLNGYLISLITFMYFSERSLPIKIEQLEDFILQKDDIRLFVGFFNYAINQRYMTSRLEEWTLKIKNNGSSISFYAVSLFLHSIKVDLSNPPPCVLNFITRSLSLIGIVHFSKKSVAKAFLKNSGIKWYFLRSIIHLDLTYFENFPLVIVEFTEPAKREEIYIDYFDSLQPNCQKLVECFISLSSIYFHTKITYNKFFFSIRHVNLLSFVTVPTYPIQVSFSDRFIESLLNLIDRQTERIPHHIFTFFTQAKMSNLHFRNLKQIIAPKTVGQTYKPYLFLLFPCLHFTSKKKKVKPFAIDDADRFSNRPPSFTRSFCRSLFIPIAPSLNQKFIDDIICLLTPVFPALSYPLIPLTHDAPLYERILLHASEPTPEMFTVASRETFFLFKASIKYANPLKQNDLTLSFLKTLTSKASHIDLVALSCHVLKKVHDISRLITTREIVNSDNFLLYLIILRRLGKMMLENWDLDVLEKIEDPERKKVFSELGTPHVIERIINCSK
ncbi:hypothetical protein TRFO_28102 [Tritrichomonas foetus]|uniref:Uncharacterized protein n=1 Tax=Tritrichomonas foetus TaxID=1144522 RepID=A0A1J4K3M4_9EUKA|nr:hypothetical protein TRFO_28102 [Tritrichomonas foetus]|eukprot:OHT04348.1 hypothetical protein TRFO_28102 [Tritrichomonas foetus]